MAVETHQTLHENLLNLSRLLHRRQRLTVLLQEIVDAAAALTESEASALLLFERETQQLYFAAIHAQQGEAVQRLRVPLEKSVAGWVYTQSKPLKISNAKVDPLVYQNIETATGKPTRNLLAVPIIYRGKALGALEVVNKIGEAPHTTADEEVLDILAGYAATGIQTIELTREARMIARERDELEKQKNNFIAITSHELRTPLGLVLGHATFLKEIVAEDTYKKQLEVIINNAERLKEIIESLNQVGSFQSGTARIRWEKADFRQLMEDVIEEFRTEAFERQVQIETEMPVGVIPVFCDAPKLGVAIGNVIKNALVFSNEGQAVNITLEKLPGHVRISVADRGIGIPAEDFHRIFERFYQVEAHLTRRHGGMGLGLSVTKAVVESHGGQIWVDSTVGEGSTFTILLPTEGTTKLG